MWFIIRLTSHDLTAITQLRNILIHFIRTTIFRNILNILTVTKEESHIIEDVIAISYNLTFSLLSIGTKYIFLFKTRKKIMQWMLCSARSTRISKSIEMINFYDDEFEFLNVRRWRITFLFLIDNKDFNIFDLDKFMNVLLFISFDISFSQLVISDLKIDSNQSLLLSCLKNNAFTLSDQNNYFFWQFYPDYNSVWFI